MKLLVDIGNTRIKWAVDDQENLFLGEAIAYKEVDLVKKIDQYWLKLSPPDVLAISSVSAKEVSQKIIKFAKIKWPDIKILIAKSSSQAFSVSNAYSNSEKLGVDRWLGLIALHHYYPGNCCIIDCGTAITIDYLDEHGQHLGGVISPGFQLMKQALYQGTEDLKLITQYYPVGLSSNTEAAIYTGALFAAAGLIEKTSNEFYNCQTVVLTGGDAELLKQYLKFEATLEPDFVLKGLSLYCQGENV